MPDPQRSGEIAFRSYGFPLREGQGVFRSQTGLEATIERFRDFDRPVVVDPPERCNDAPCACGEKSLRERNFVRTLDKGRFANGWKTRLAA